MNLRFHIAHVCHISVIFTAINGYILFAANIEDFKTIIKKYIPDHFADKLARIASETSLFKRGDDGNERKNYTPAVNNMPKDRSRPDNQDVIKDHIEKTINFTERSRSGNDKSKMINLSGIDIDDLVEKIKERLDSQYIEKYKQYLSTKGNMAQEVEEEETTMAEKSYTKMQKHSVQRPKKTESNENEKVTESQPKKRQPKKKGHQEVTLQPEVPEFEETYLTKKTDSYEDYEMPHKKGADTNKEKPTPRRTTRNRPHVTPKHKMQTYDDKNQKDYESEEKNPKDHDKGDYDYKAYRSDEIKAKTEILNYDYQHSYKETGNKPSKPKGTGMPTRERFSMSSPNYYASIPVKAEKYDFNEPLPERDREPEDVYLGDPSAKINKKVSLL